MDKVFFVGGGPGGVAAFKSLQTVWDSIEVVTDDDELHQILRGDDTLVSSINEVSCQQGVMAGYLGLLPKEFVDAHDILNVHYSLLPEYRGLHSVVWAMLNLEKQLGYTVHVVNEHMDDGPIAFQESLEYKGETSWEVMKKLNALVEQNLGGNVCAYFEGQREVVEQDKRFATWVPRRNLNSCLIDYSWGVRRLKALFKALVRPYPLPALMIRGKRYEVSCGEILSRTYYCDLGRVVNIDDDGVWIKCEDSLLILKELLDDSGRAVDPANVIHLGMRLNSN
ncbi:formyltransferase family protein [Akkermansiaceae bacterium]|nr:formyltransferase family protein [Akkermansiaceae bacterium]